MDSEAPWFVLGMKDALAHKQVRHARFQTMTSVLG